MKKRLGYMMPFLAFGFMFGGAFSAHGQSQPGGASGISVSSGVYSTESGITAEIAAHRDSLRNILVLLKAKLKEALALKDEKVISDVKGEVKYALNEQFANDLAIQESKLAVLIKRADIAESRNKLRLDSKDELIELQLKSYVLETDGPANGSSELELDSQSLFGSRRQSKPDVFFTDPNGVSPSNLAVERTTANPIFPAADDRPAVDELSGATPGRSALGSRRRLHQSNNATIEEARMKLARAASVAEETQATKELKNALVAYFDLDMEEREQILKTVRAEIEQMKQKLEKRASSKNSIIELQFKMFVNEASGLGFFSPPATTDRIDATIRY